MSNQYQIGDRVRINNQTSSPILVGIEGIVVEETTSSYTTIKIDQEITPYRREIISLHTHKYDLISDAAPISNRG